MKKFTGISLFIFFCVVSAILTAGLVFFQNSKSNLSVTNNAVNTLSTLPVGVILNIAEVSKHNTNADCWIIVNNKIYNISNYASSHPGGSRNILNYCGKEATQAFNTKGGQGNSHSLSANAMLTQFYVGDLNQSVNQNTLNQTIQNTQSNPTPVNNRGGDDD